MLSQNRGIKFLDKVDGTCESEDGPTSVPSWQFRGVVGSEETSDTLTEETRVR